MKAEIRADGLHITGYVNVTGKMSRPVITGNGQKVIEVIEERAFSNALKESSNIPMTLDHNGAHVLAQTEDRTLELQEDAIGLRAEAVINDPEVIEGAKAGKLKGWSFGMRDIVDRIEERADNLPLRHVKEFILDHVTLVMNKVPCYAATSIEVRAGGEGEIDIESVEVRTTEESPDVLNMVVTPKEPINYSEYESRIQQIESTL